MYRKYILLLLILASSLLSPKTPHAHPADEIGITAYDQKQMLEASPDKSILTIDLTFYAFEKMELWGSLNTDTDQDLTQKEKDQWMQIGSDASWLEISGHKHIFTATKVSVPNYDEFFSSKPVDISIEFTSKVRIKPGDTISYFYMGKDKKLAEIAFEAKGTNGLKVVDVKSDSSDSTSFKIEEGPQGETETFGMEASDRLNNFLDTYVKADLVPVGLQIVALGISFLIGMLHALTPGHGKAMVAGYLVGEKGTIWQAVQLGIIITITHTFSVFLLGLGTLLLTQYIVPSVVINWLTLTSGFLVAGFGIYLLVKRVSEFSKFKKDGPSEVDEIVHHSNQSHTHNASAVPNSAYAHPHSHSHPHSHNHSIDELTWRNLLPLGVSGGLVPCIDALAILIVAISLGKIVLGLTFLIAFSLGLASALILGGILVVVAKNKIIKKFERFEKFERYSSIASAVIVTILGLAIIFGKPV